PKPRRLTRRPQPVPYHGRPHRRPRTPTQPVGRYQRPPAAILQRIKIQAAKSPRADVGSALLPASASGRSGLGAHAMARVDAGSFADAVHAADDGGAAGPGWRSLARVVHRNE